MEELYQLCEKYADEAIEEMGKCHYYAFYYLEEADAKFIINRAIHRAIYDMKKAQSEELHASCNSCGEIFLDHACL